MGEEAETGQNWRDETLTRRSYYDLHREKERERVHDYVPTDDSNKSAKKPRKRDEPDLDHAIALLSLFF